MDYLDKPIITNGGASSYCRQEISSECRLTEGKAAAGRALRRAPRLHDLRRTVATGAQAAGVLPHTVAAVLNHSTAGLFGVTAIYRDRQEEAKRAAMDAWDRRLRDIIRISPATPP
jgi:integrase